MEQNHQKAGMTWQINDNIIYLGAVWIIAIYWDLPVTSVSVIWKAAVESKPTLLKQQQQQQLRYN